jgi:hypothetical protein
VDQNAKLEEARRKAAVLQQQLEQLRAQGGDIANEARIKNELMQVNQVLGNAYAAGGAPGQPYGQRPMGYNPNGNYMASRASMILVFGILSLVVCQLFGPFAWSMGSEDLRRMDQGVMDPRERGTVQAGRICGMIGTGLMILSILFVFAFFVLAAGTASQY